jgi:hypothetical protein
MHAGYFAEKRIAFFNNIAGVNNGLANCML